MATPTDPDWERLEAFDERPMRVGLGTYRALDDSILRLTKQLGVEDFLLTPWGHDDVDVALPTGEAWSYEDIRERRDRIEAAGLRLYALETMPIPLYDILTAEDDERGDLIEEILTTVRNMGRAGVPVLGYSGHHPAGVGRTGEDTEVRGGARATSFDARALGDEMLLERTYTEAELWAAYEEFLDAVIPVAEEWVVTLGVHPSDPPVEEMGGVPMLFRSRENFDRAMDIVDSEHHGLKLGLGCWSEMGEDIPSVIRHFGDDIVYVHFRDVVGSVPAFYETFVDDPDSNFDEYEVMRALHEVGFSGVMTPDHVPEMEGEDVWEFGGPRGRSFTVGYLRGLLEGVVRAG